MALASSVGPSGGEQLVDQAQRRRHGVVHDGTEPLERAVPGLDDESSAVGAHDDLGPFLETQLGLLNDLGKEFYYQLQAAPSNEAE